MGDFVYHIDGAKAVDYEEPFKPENPLNRPEISYFRFALALVLFFAVCIGVFFLSDCLLFEDSQSQTLFSVLSALLAGVLYCLAIAKKAVIWLVKVYQHYAPDDVRLKCVFEPSCSEYMILAVKKYGAFKGVYKGIKRLFRCGSQSGVDYP